jgi:nucleotide-binding universal stress UspA family protein
MFDVVLFPTDGSEGARATVDRVFDLARAHDASVHAVYVLEAMSPQKSVADLVSTQLRERGRAALDDVESEGARLGVPVTTSIVDLDDSVSNTILGVVDDVDADVVVLPMHGRRGLERYILGSVTERVVRQSPVPVLTVPVFEQSE